MLGQHHANNEAERREVQTNISHDSGGENPHKMTDKVCAQTGTWNPVWASAPEGEKIKTEYYLSSMNL